MSDERTVFEEAADIIGPELVAKLRARAAQRLIDKPLTEEQIDHLARLLIRDDGPARR